MSSMMDRLAAALMPLPIELRGELAKALLAGTAAVPRVTRPRAVKPAAALLDERITAELWLAGEHEVLRARQRAERSAMKRKSGPWRRSVVRFADGFEVVTGSFFADDAVARAACVRFARARWMSESLGCDRAALIDGANAAAETWIWTGEHHVKTRVCPTPAVESVEFKGSGLPVPIEVARFGEIAGPCCGLPRADAAPVVAAMSEWRMRFKHAA